MRRVNIQPAAEREIKKAYQWYRDRDARDAAERMLGEIEDAISRLQRFAHTFSVVDRTSSGAEIRHHRLKRFPYMLVYVIDETDRVQVIAFAHVRRSRYWRARS